jgi:hypothetical protein
MRSGITRSQNFRSGARDPADTIHWSHRSNVSPKGAPPTLEFGTREDVVEFALEDWLALHFGFLGLDSALFYSGFLGEK